MELEEQLCEIKKSWDGAEIWLKRLTQKLSTQYNEFKEDLYTNNYSRNSSQYFEYFANHYYKLTRLYEEFYFDQEFNLNSFKYYSEKCLECLNKITEPLNSKKIDTQTKAIQRILIRNNSCEKELSKCDVNNSSEYIKLCIQLGDVNNNALFDQHLNTYKLEERKTLDNRVRNIQLLELIISLEESMQNEANLVSIAMITQHLFISQAYELVGHSSISKIHESKSKDLVKQHVLQVPNNIQNKNTSFTAQQLRKVMKDEISNSKCRLDKLKTIIKTKAKRLTELSNVDDDYISRKYVKYCFEQYLKEVENYFQTAVIDHHKITDISEKLKVAVSLLQIPEIFKDFEYYKLLIPHLHLIEHEKQRQLMIELYNAFSNCVFKKNKYSDAELVLLQKLIEYLNTFPSLESIIVKLQLTDFITGNLNFSDIINNIINDTNDNGNSHLMILKTVAKQFVGKHQFMNADKIRNDLRDYIMPPEICEKPFGNQQIIQVIGKHIAISAILTELELMLSNSSTISEVRLVSANIIHIDANLNNEKWHGMNIMLLSKMAIVHNTVQWDVSGADNTNQFEKAQDGRLVGESGRPGRDGCAGESGGNVLFLVDKIKNAQNLTIISFGGRGGIGQDGGDGANGKDGSGITKSEFNKLFPSAAKFGIFASKAKADIITNMLKDSTIVTKWEKNANIYLEVKRNSKHNHCITFSYYCNSLIRGQCAYLIYKGSSGIAGGKGGECGIGGQAGYPGEINCSNDLITVNTGLGVDGENGISGICGKNGVNGWDIGFVDTTFLIKFWKNIEYPKYFGEHGNSRLKLLFSNSGVTDDYIWCPYREHQRLPYHVTIKEVLVNTTQLNLHQERTATVSNRQRQHYALATRKKTMSTSNIISTYAQFVSLNRSSLNAINNNNNNNEVRNEQIEEDSTHDIVIKRQRTSHTSSFTQSLDNSTPFTIKMNTQELPNFNQLMRELSSSLNINWFKISKIPLKCNEINTLYSYYEKFVETSKTSQQSVNKNSNQEQIGKLLSDKYRFAILYEIAKQKPLYETGKDMSTSASAANLKEVPMNYNGNPSELDELDHYFNGVIIWQQKFFECCKGMIKADTNSKVFENSIKVFVKEKGDCTQFDCAIKKHYDSFKKYSAEKIRRISSRWDELKAELLLPQHAAIVDLWNKNGKANCYRYLLDEEMKKDAKLNALYNSYVLAVEEQYDWSICCKDPEIINAFLLHIEKGSTLSTSYRELLADMNEVNIKLYVEDANEQLILLDEHNSSGCKQYHVLCRGNKFSRLEIDNECANLEWRRKMSSVQYADILSNVYSLSKKTELDNYLSYFNQIEVEQSDLSNRPISVESNNIDINNIIKFFSDKDEKQKLEMRLNKITSKFIGPHNVLKYISQRFAVEGCHVSAHELYCLVNSIASSVVDGRNELVIFEWIVAAYPQQYWIDELVLLQIENYLKSSAIDKIQCRQHLSKICNKNILVILKCKLEQTESPVTFENIHETLKRLKYVTKQSLKLEQIEFNFWHSALKDNLAINISSTTTPQQVDNDRTVTELVSIIYKDDNTSRCVKNTLKNIETNIKYDYNNNYSYFVKYNYITQFNKELIRTWMDKFKQIYRDKCRGDSQKFLNKSYPEMLAVIERGIFLVKKIHLRDTQKLTILTLLKNKQNTLAQVSTGEGKSLIVIAVAIMKALCGEKVDIITSSSVLATRDATENADIYKLFLINVSHNCSEDIEQRKLAYSSNQVVYGDLSYFQRDYLLDRFYGKNILGDRDFQNIIVDEVDSMLLDKGNNILYLSHDIPGFDKVESIYIFIWQKIQTQSSDDIENDILRDVYGRIMLCDLRVIDPRLKDEQIQVLWNGLLKAEFIDNQGNFLIKDDNSETLDRLILPPEFERFVDGMKFLVKQVVRRHRVLNIPNYLLSFVSLHLRSWISSAQTAFKMVERTDYIVDVDRSGSTSNRHPIITILDKDTGTDESNSEWSEALHQFLQLKHGCKLTLQNLKSVFISNISYFKLYNHLYGLTGSLGLLTERDMLKEMHNVSFVTIPTSRTKQFVERPVVMCPNTNHWIKEICGNAKNVASTEGRSVLIICETVYDVDDILKVFNAKGIPNVHTYKRNYIEFEYANGTRELEPGHIIIATNLAGRGTDIKLNQELRDAGGLHVCLTFLPTNSRIEEQAFGRSARCGDPGSGQLIINRSNQIQKRSIKIEMLKKTRDFDEIYRIIHIKNMYKTEIMAEENCFEMFKMKYTGLKKMLDTSKLPNGVKEVLSKCCIDKWAHWLDENGVHIKNAVNKYSQKQIQLKLNSFLAEFDKLSTESVANWSAWTNNPFHKIILGRYSIEQNKLDDAIALFHQVIEDEPNFAEAAYYYKAYVQSKKDVAFDYELTKALQLFNRHSELVNCSLASAEKFKQNNTLNLVQIKAFQVQQQSFLIINDKFVESINAIRGEIITPKHFYLSFKCDILTHLLHRELLNEKILLGAVVLPNISEVEVRTLALDYGLIDNTLLEFLREFVNQEINTFQLKAAIPLPNREMFWNLLLDTDILSNEVKYLIVDQNNLQCIDPLLFETMHNECVRKETLLNTNDCIFIYDINVEESDLVFVKQEFIAIAGTRKYKFMKEMGVFKSNKKAKIAVDDLKSIVFPYRQYDGITVNDFKRIGCSNNDAKNILAELVSKKILRQENDIYRLEIQYEQISQINLPSFAVYQDAVISLLTICFAYRIALQQLERYCETMPNDKAGFTLVPKIHRRFLYGLAQLYIVKPNSLAANIEDVEKRLLAMYSNTFSKLSFKQILGYGRLIAEERITDQLLMELEKKKWIVKKSVVEHYVGNNITGINSARKFIEMAKDMFSSSYTYVITTADCRQGLASEFKDIEWALTHIFNIRLNLDAIGEIQKIAETLKRSTSDKKQKFELIALKDNFDQRNFVNLEEIQTVRRNGLEHLISKKMKSKIMPRIGSVIIFAIGVSEILFAVLELFRQTNHVALSNLLTGFEHCMYGINSFRSNNFSWETFRSHTTVKAILRSFSGIYSAKLKASFAVFSIGKSLSLSNISSFAQTIKSLLAKFKNTQEEVMADVSIRRSILRTTETFDSVLKNTEICALVEDSIHSICNNISFSILKQLECAINAHDIVKSLEKSCQLLNKSAVTAMADTIRNKYFVTLPYTIEFKTIASEIKNVVIAKITEKLESNAIDKLDELPLQLEPFIVDFQTMIHNFLDNINDDINKNISNNTCNSTDTKENITTGIIEEWKSVISTNAELNIDRYIVQPIFTNFANTWFKHTSKNMRSKFADINRMFGCDDNSENESDPLSQGSSNDLRLNEAKPNNVIIKHIDDMYNRAVFVIMFRKKNLELFEHIIRENIPMHTVCIPAINFVIQEVLQNIGFPTAKVNFSLQDDDSKINVVIADGKECVVLANFKPKYGYFQLVRKEFSVNNAMSTCAHNFLLNALYEHFNIANINLAKRVPLMQFKNKMVYVIANNSKAIDIITLTENYKCKPPGFTTKTKEPVVLFSETINV